MPNIFSNTIRQLPQLRIEILFYIVCVSSLIACISTSSIDSSQRSPVVVDIDHIYKEKFIRAVLLITEKKFGSAILLLEEVTEQVTMFPGPYINLGVAYAQLRVLDKAEENFKKALAINKNHRVANNQLGMVYRKTGRFLQARILYENILKLYPDFLPARRNLGMLCDIYIQDHNCAVEQYAFYLKAFPKDLNIKTWLENLQNRL